MAFSMTEQGCDLPGRLEENSAPITADRADSPREWWQWLRRPAAPTCTARRGRVLLISYQFPPTGGSGVQRPAKLAKYLPQWGWSVEVLTAAHDRFPWIDTSLLTDLPDELIMHRVAGREPACVADWLGSGCARIGGMRFGHRVSDAMHWRLTGLADRMGLANGESLWTGPAVRAAVREHRRRPYDAVISTGPPHFVHQVALHIARTTGLPWLAELRDPLVSDFDRTGPSHRQVQRGQSLERAILQQADRVVTTCPTFAWDLRERYPHRAARIQAITNGFDREDILRALETESAAGQQAWPPDILGDPANECVFVAAGAFYGRRELCRLIRPLHRLIQLHPAWAGRVKLVVAGTIDAEQRRMLEPHRHDWVTFTGYVDHAHAIRLTASAACSIVIVPACEHGTLSIPGKTFELLALPTHVLGLVPPGSDTEHILRRAGGCTVTPFEREHAITSTLRSIIEAHFAGRLRCTRDWRRVDGFDRRVIARRFADALGALCGQSPHEGGSDVDAAIPAEVGA